MRLFLLVLVALSLVCPSVFADEKDVIDTGKGLQFQKASGWAKAANKKGVVASLNAAGDPAAQIEFRWAKVEPKKTKQYFNSFHASLATALKRVVDPKETTYGKLVGVLTEYETGEKDATNTVLVYQFAQGDSAWLVVGMFSKAKRDLYVSDLEKMLATIVVAP